jgi:hypothetical protein
MCVTRFAIAGVVMSQFISNFACGIVAPIPTLPFTPFITIEIMELLRPNNISEFEIVPIYNGLAVENMKLPEDFNAPKNVPVFPLLGEVNAI